MNKNVLAAISIFAICIFLTIIGFFLLGIEQIALHFWALGSLLFSLVVSALAVVTLLTPEKTKGRVFYTSGMSAAVWLYVVAIIISVVFTKSFAENPNGFILLQMVTHALFFAAVIIICRISVHIRNGAQAAYENLQNGEYSKPKRGGF